MCSHASAACCSTPYVQSTGCQCVLWACNTCRSGSPCCEKYPFEFTHDMHRLLCKQSFPCVSNITYTSVMSSQASDPSQEDVRTHLAVLRRHVLSGTHIMFSHVIPRDEDMTQHHMWLLATRVLLPISLTLTYCHVHAACVKQETTAFAPVLLCQAAGFCLVCGLQPTVQLCSVCNASCKTAMGLMCQQQLSRRSTPAHIVWISYNSMLV